MVNEPLTEQEIAALRALRPLAEKAIHLLGEGIARGVVREEREVDLRRGFEALAVIDRLTGDGPKVWTHEEQALACVRVGNAAGYVVEFSPDGVVTFVRGDLGIAVPELLVVDEPIEDHLALFLDSVAERRDDFFKWLDGLSPRGGT